MQQRSQFLQKNLFMAHLEKSDEGKKHHDLRPSQILRFERNFKAAVAAFENLLINFAVEDKVGLYCISSGLRAPPDIQEDLMREGKWGNQGKEDFISDKNFFDPIKKSKLKTFERGNVKVFVKTSDKK